MKKIFLTLIFLFVTHTTYAQTFDDVQKHQNCKYCGMNRNQFAHSRMLITYEDSSEIGTCSLHCTAIELAVNLDKNIKKIEVADFYNKKLIDAEKAFWVIGGKLPGVMTKNAKWAFERKEDADQFVKENGGKISSFEDAIKTTYNDMYQDTKMIREKRKKMKKMEGQKHGEHSH